MPRNRPTCYLEACLPPRSLWCPDADATLVVETIRDALAGRWVRTPPTGAMLTEVEVGIAGRCPVVVHVDRN